MHRIQENVNVQKGTCPAHLQSSLLLLGTNGTDGVVCVKKWQYLQAHSILNLLCVLRSVLAVNIIHLSFLWFLWASRNSWQWPQWTGMSIAIISMAATFSWVFRAQVQRHQHWTSMYVYIQLYLDTTCALVVKSGVILGENFLNTMATSSVTLTPIFCVWCVHNNQLSIVEIPDKATQHPLILLVTWNELIGAPS